ncbi:MAG: SDR family NAD(P)-dependent oxidoreductase, partial [Phycicoccus sp.]
MTGAANGIGRALTQLLHSDGIDLLLIDCDEIGLKDVASDLAGGALTCLADLSALDGIQRACDAIAALDRPAALVNNAGMYRGKPLAAYDDTTIESDYRVNVVAPMLLTQAYAAPLFARRQRGIVVNVASTAGEIGSSDAVYGSAKAAVIGLTKSQAMNYAPWVRVNCISPGMV